jgi:hypothetical protein
VRSSSVGAALLAVALTSCTGGAVSGPTGTKQSGVMGYVNMDALVKKHPLYGELERLDADMQALELKSLDASLPRASGADLAREEKILQKQLDEAANRTKKALKDKQEEYAKREQAAIAAALSAAGGPPGPSGATIAGGVARQSAVQAGNAGAVAHSDLDAYRSQTLAQNRTALLGLQRSLEEKAGRTYRTKAEDLQRKESDFALAQANQDAAERLSLSTKLQNLALDDADRAETRKQLDALNQKESDGLGALKNRDQAILVALQTQLRDQSKTEFDKQFAILNAKTVAQMKARDQALQAGLVGQLGSVAVSPGGAPGRLSVSSDMRAKLEALHKKYQDDFNKDAEKTIADFQKTRNDLTQRFQRLEGIDSDAQGGTSRQLDALQKQRGELYDEMVAQIDREVRLIAEKRGVNVVFSSIIAPAGGVDLTADAEKDIESLHE